MTLLLETGSSRDIAAAEAVEDRVAGAKLRLEEVARGDGHGRLEWDRPKPSAAFSRRDVTAPGFVDAVRAMRSRGFTPFVRPVGGRMAAYHEGALVLDLLVRDSEPRAGTTARFRGVAEALVVGLRRLGVDAQVGGVPGEYCPGTWSVNAGGRHKLAGTGQRLAQGAVLVTAVIVVGDAEPLRDAMAEAYDLLGLELDPTTVGSVSDVVPGVTLDDVEETLGHALAERLGLGGPDLVGGRALGASWQPR